MQHRNERSPAQQVLLSTSRFDVVRVALAAVGGQTVYREVIRHPGAAVIVPWVDQDHVCLIRNYRASIGQTLLELPAGTIDRGESPLETARRELAEETGFVAGHLELIHSFYPAPGILDECMHLLVATQLRAGEPSREQGEQITNQVMRWQQAMEMVDKREIKDAKTLIGLMLVDRLRRSLILQR